MHKAQLFGYIIAIILCTTNVVWAASAADAVATAQPKAPADLKQELEATYQKLLKNPANVALNLRYAEVAIELKDYESAIPPLERLLFYNPGLDDVKLKLGILYYLLKSSDMARTYFTEVANSAGAAEELKVQANQYLKKLGG